MSQGKAFNTALKAMAMYLRIPNRDLDEIFGLLDQPDYFTKSRIKAWLAAWHDRKYRPMDASDFASFCAALSIHLKDQSANVEVSPDTRDWLDQLQRCFVGEINSTALFVFADLIEHGSDDPNDPSFFYSRMLHQFCAMYNQALHLEKGFETTRSNADQRLLGILWLLCESGTRIKGSAFNVDTYTEWSAQVLKELSRDGLPGLSGDVEVAANSPTRSTH